MKHYLTLVILTISTICISQDWLPQETTWHYTNNSWGLPYNIGELKIKGDTLIQGITCSILHRNKTTCDYRPSEEYIFKNNDQLFYYEFSKEKFELLYDFNTQVGDIYSIATWEGLSTLEDDSIYIRVDSIKNIELPYSSLDHFYVTYGRNINDSIIYHPFPVGEYIEDLGSLFTFFHYPENGGCDGLHTTELRCFSHPEYSTHNFIEDNCDSITVSNSNNNIENKIDIFPNPTSNFITIEASTTSDYIVELHTINGETLNTYKFENQSAFRIYVEQFNSGIYLVSIKNLKKSIIQTFKIGLY